MPGPKGLPGPSGPAASRAAAGPAQTAHGGGLPASGPCGVRRAGTGLVTTPDQRETGARAPRPARLAGVWAETIYQALYCQARGQLTVRREGCLRRGGTARVGRDQRRAMTAGREAIPDKVLNPPGRPRPPTGRCQGTGRAT